MTNIHDRVTLIIAEQLGLEMSTVLPAAQLEDDLGADSLDLVELVMAIEDEFGLEISDEDAEKCKTVQSIVDYVTKAAKS